MAGIHQAQQKTVIHRNENKPAALHHLLDHRAENHADKVILRTLTDDGAISDTLTPGQLAANSRRIAGGLLARGMAGKPVLLAEPPGPGFVECLFACWRAGAIAVPVYPPRGSRHRQRFEAVARDSGATLAITAGENPSAMGIATVSAALLADAPEHDGIAGNDDLPCLLQYTSGSTSSPKGVMISHANLRAHYRSLSIYRDLEIRSVLSWLPPYHDMGLVLKILFAFEAGIPLFWMSPEQFTGRPLRWLRAISNHRAEMSGGPNFAFETCLRSVTDDDLASLDLSCWKAAPCGAERIRPETLERFAERFAPCGFRKEAFLPGYGLAESTLIVTAHAAGRRYETIRHPGAGKLVSCGKPLGDVSLHICDPETGAPLPDGQTGEIRIAAPVVASGYWRRDQETRTAFPGDGYGLKTGDLGLIDDGRLFVAGRIKDLLIIDGVNIAPEDIEGAALVTGVLAAAAFATDDGRRESAILVIEAPRGDDLTKIRSRVREAVAKSAGVSLNRCIVVRPGAIPRTTSGKIRRSACREAWLGGHLRIELDDQAPACKPDVTVHHAVIEAARHVSGNAAITHADDLLALGFGSLDIARLRARIEELTGVRIPLSRLMSARGFGEISELVASSSTDGLWTSLPSTGRAITHSQERMWLLHEFDPDSPAYHVFGTVEFEGPLDVAALGKAFDAAVGRHDMLRSRHGMLDGVASSWIDNDDRPPPLVSGNCEDPETRLRDFARKPFRLSQEPPARAMIARIGPDRHLMGFCAHHVAMDGWSMRILARELAHGYLLALEDKPIEHGRDAPDFRAHAARHRAWIDGGGADDQIAWWKDKLAGHSGTIDLPLDFSRPAKPSFKGSIETETLPQELCDAISRLAAQHHATPFMVHLAAFVVLLRQHGAGDDLVSAIPVANRHLPGTGGVVGTLVNTLPFRIGLDGGESFSSLLDRVRGEGLAMLDNQDAPFERIVAELKAGRSADHAPIAQVMFDHQEMPIAERWPGGVTCRPGNIHRGGTQFDLSLLLNAFSDHQQLAIEYRTDLFLPETIATMLDRHLALLARICGQPERSVADLSVPAGNDAAFLDARTNGPKRPGFGTSSTPELIARRIALHPSRRAVADADGWMDYATLGEVSDRVAAGLAKAGLRPGMRMAVLPDRDRNLPAVLLGVWKCGAAYVPLDPSNPKTRLATILEDMAPIKVLVSESRLDLLPEGADTIICENLIREAPDKTAGAEFDISRAAYVIHTSGSTGRPKGVVVGHRALANFLLSMAETPGFTEADRLLAVTTVSFDISLLEMFLPLVTGGAVTISPSGEAADAEALATRLRTGGITVMQATPATWRLLLDSGWRGSPTLKILCGGEAMEPDLARRLAPLGCQLWNLYGPTETTVWSTCWRVPTDARDVGIGAPIANTGVHVLGPDGSPRPPGVTGELWISGIGLADGYWNDPDMTSARFRTITDHRGHRLRAYATGDLAKWSADGTLECLGRGDGQVKIRGFRVELGEIEAALASHPAVSQARVALRGDRPESRRLVAWVKLSDASTAPDPTSFKRFLAERLPAHMIPADLGRVDSFPLGPSGKVDVSRLDDPAPCPRPAEEVDATTRKLIDLWNDLLGRTDVHPDDDWFQTGGHSLLALRLFSMISDGFGPRLPLSAILENPTPRGLARAINREINTGSP